MVSVAIARNVVGVIGNIFSLFLFLSPLPTFIRICKKGAVEQYSATPYLTTLINCMFWVLYGMPWVHPNSTLILTINVAGTLIELVFLTLFLIYSDKKKRAKVAPVVVGEVIIVVVLTVLVLTLLHTIHRRSMVVGIICVIFCSMTYASPLSVMKLVIRTKSVEYMPVSLSLATFANCVTWTCYAFLPYDPFALIPSLLGIAFSVSQLILYATYYKSTKRQMEAAQKEAETGRLSQDMVGNGNSHNHNIDIPDV
ncbi:hypothetical protein SLA2020_123230 [Shorea laevis]